MALPASGVISLNNVNVELSLAGTTAISMGQASVRTLFGQASGSVDMNTGHGKANSFTFTATIASNTQDYNLRAAAVTAGWDGSTALIASVTINTGVIVSASSTAAVAFDTGITFPTGTTLTLTNNGSIVGKGGTGGAGGVNAFPASQGSIGGNAFKAQASMSVNNVGTISSGSGGQGGSGAVRTGYVVTSGNSILCGAGNISCTGRHYYNQGYCDNNTGATGATGGATGVAGSSGSAGSTYTNGSGYNCGTLCTGGSASGVVNCGTGAAGAGGLAGAAVVGNSNITWTATGTRNGAIT